MSSQITFGNGSKRNVRRVRWTLRDIVSLLLLMIIIAVASVAAAVWLNAHDVN